MKRIILKITSMLIAAASLISLAACSSKKGEPVMTLGGSVVTDRMYEYWMCSYKASLMSQYSDAKDTADFWDMKLGDKTAEDFFYELTYDYIESNLVCMYLFDKYSLEIDKEDRETAKSIIDDLEKEYADGSRNDFNRLLANYGVNADLLLDIYLDELKSTLVYNHVFENSLLTVGDEEKEDYLNKSYVRVRQIYINNKYDYERSSYDSDGNFIMADLSPEAKAEKDAKAASARAELDAGADFDEVYEKYSEDTAYPNGYYLSLSTENLPQELINNAFSLDVGESAEFESIYGTHMIMRLEMDKAPYDNDENADFFGDFKNEVYESVFTDFVTSFYDEITVDSEAISKYTIRDSLPNYSFQY